MIKKCIWTYLNKDRWEQGVQWIRSVKQAGIIVLVVDMGLDDEQLNKLQELNIRTLPNTKKVGVNQSDVFNTLASDVLEDCVYLYWDVSIQCEEVSAFWTTQKLCANLDKITNIPALVYPLAAINTRVVIGKRLEETNIKNFGSPLFAGLFAGKAKSWQLFAGFYTSLVETGIIEPMVPAANLALNLFALYYPNEVETRQVDYEIPALQQPRAG